MAIVINGQTGIDAGHLPISNAGNTEIEGTLTGADVTVASITANSVITQGQNVSPFSGFKNYIINGNFDVWQRGVAFVPALSTDTYTADRWIAYIAGAGKNVQRLVADANFRNKYGISIDGTNSCSDSYILTRLEGQNCHCLHGKTVTLSFKVIATNAGSMIVKISRPNTFDSYVANQITVIDEKSITLNAGVNSISYQVSFNQIDPTYGLQIAFHFGALGVSDDRFITDIQLEEGSVATPFENRPYGLELSLCQRYLPSFTAFAGTGTVRSATAAAITIPFKVAPRVPPTGIIVSGYGNIENGGTWLQMVGTFSTASITSANTLWTNGAATMTIGQGSQLNLGTNTILFTGCEL